MKVGFTFYLSPPMSNTWNILPNFKQYGHDITYLMCREKCSPAIKIWIRGSFCGKKLIAMLANVSVWFRMGQDKCLNFVKGASGLFGVFDDIKSGVLSSIISKRRINLQKEELENEDEFQRLLASSISQFYAICDAIEANNLDKIVIFNGRMDFTAAAVAAARFCSTLYIERSWIGYGLNITHNGVPLDLKPYRDVLDL